MYFVYAALIIAAVIFIVTVVICIKEGDVAENIFAGFMGSVILGGVIIVAGNAVGLIWTDSVTVSNGVTYIQSVADGQQTKGSFFLGSGYIDSEPAYFFYYSTGPGQFKQSYVTGDVTIREQADVTPFVEYFQTTSDDKNWSFMRGGGQDDHWTVITVPVGTVIKNYTLDTSAK